MDSSCLTTDSCLTSLILPNRQTYLILKYDSILYLEEWEIMSNCLIRTLSVPPDPAGTQTFDSSGYKMRLDDDGLLYIFYPSNAYSVFDLEFEECTFQAMYGGKRPYIPNEVIVASNYMILTTLTSNNIYTFNMANLHSQKAIKKPNKIKIPKTSRVNCLVVKPGTPLLCAGCTDGVIRVWDMKTGQEGVGLIDPGSDMTVTKKVVASLLKSVKYAQVNCLHFTENGGKLLAGDDGGYLYVWKTDNLQTNKYSLEANLRISERGIMSIKWLQYANYETDGYFLALIKEGSLLLLQHSFSTVYSKSEAPSKNIKSSIRIFPAKISVINQSLLTLTPEVTTDRQMNYTLQNCLQVHKATLAVIINWPQFNFTTEVQSKIAKVTASISTTFKCLFLANIDQPYYDMPIVSGVDGFADTNLIPEPITYPSSFFYIAENSIWKYNLIDGQSESVAAISEGQTFTNSYTLDYRPITTSASYQFLITRQVKTHYIITYVECKGEEINRSMFSGVQGLLLGPKEELARYLFLLNEDRTSAALFEIANLDGAIVVAQFHTKIRSVHWTPLRNGHVICYETLNEHAIRFSNSAISHDQEDVELSEHYLFKLNYDETVLTMKWLENCAIATNQRILILDQQLRCVNQFNLRQLTNEAIMISPLRVLSLFWFGQMVIFSNERNIFYLDQNKATCIMSLERPAIIGCVLLDRIIIVSNREKPVVNSRPVMLLEPLLLSLLATAKKQTIVQVAEKAESCQISSQLINKLLGKQLSEVAWFLVQTANTPQFTQDIKVKILKDLEKFDEVLNITLHGKDINNEYDIGNFLAEADHNTKNERKILQELIDYFMSKQQYFKAAKCMELVGDQLSYAGLMKKLELEFLEDSKNPVIVALKGAVARSIPFDQTLKSFNIPAAVADEQSNLKANFVKREIRGYGEAPFLQMNDQKMEIAISFYDNIGQVFGYASLKDPIKSVKPQFIGEEKKSEDSDQEFEEENAILLYIRADEGKGDTIGDVVSGNTYTMDPDSWGEKLEDGEPMDYEDNWGKKSDPNYELKLNTNDKLILNKFTDKAVRSFSIEFWLQPEIIDQQVVFTFGDFQFEIEESYPGFYYKGTKVSLKDQDLENEREHDRVFRSRVWAHVAIIYKAKILKLYLNAKLIQEGHQYIEPLPADISICPFGSVTEIRIWNTELEKGYIQENYRCPLGILSEKRRKKWATMRIKKSEEKPAVTPLAGPTKSVLAGPPSKLKAPARPLGGLRPPPGGPRRLAAPPAKSPNISMSISRIKADDLSISSIMPDESRDDLQISDFNMSVASEMPAQPSSPTSPKIEAPEESKAEPGPTINDHIEKCMHQLEEGELPESLESLDAALKMLIVQAHSLRSSNESIGKFQNQIIFVVSYKLAIQLAVKIYDLKSESSEESQTRCALLCNLILKVKLRPSHRKMFSQIAIIQNLTMRNFGAAAKIIENYLDTKDALTPEESQKLEAKLEEITERTNDHAIPSPCSNCGETLPYGPVETECAACKKRVVFCYETYDALTDVSATRCPVCMAWFSKIVRPDGEKCSFCSLGKVAEN